MPAIHQQMKIMRDYFAQYLAAQKAALDSIPTHAVSQIVEKLRETLHNNRQLFVFGNGGSAANASHFVTDLGKGSSDATGKRFRCLSLNDNVSWITALGNDYAYDEIFSRQLMNYAQPGDIALTMSVSGSSPNLVKALEWAKQNDVYTIALVGGRKGKLAAIADLAVVIDATHYGRVEDAHMGICHMICYAFMELPELKEQ